MRPSVPVKHPAYARMWPHAAALPAKRVSLKPLPSPSSRDTGSAASPASSSENQSMRPLAKTRPSPVGSGASPSANEGPRPADSPNPFPLLESCDDAAEASVVSLAFATGVALASGVDVVGGVASGGAPDAFGSDVGGANVAKSWICTAT